MSDRSDKSVKQSTKTQQSSDIHHTTDATSQSMDHSQGVLRKLASSANSSIDASSLTPATIHQLQRTIGNQEVLRLLKNQPKGEPLQRSPENTIQRGWIDDVVSGIGNTVSGIGNAVSDAASFVGNAVGDAASFVGNAVGDALDIRDNEAALDLWEDYESSMDELVDFIGDTHTEENFQSSTRIGFFDASYSPGNNELTITCRCKFNFVNGTAAQFPTASAADLTWTDEAKENWRNQFLNDCSTAWSGNHTFFCQKDWWEMLQASVNVRFTSAESDEHFALNVKKIPPGEFDRSSVTSPQPILGGLLGYTQGTGDFDSEDLTTVNKPGGQQQAAVHESGHMLGLDDEYFTGETDAPSHSDMVDDELGHGVARGEDGRIMSGGMDIEPEHGVTFLEALKAATGMDEWSTQAKSPTPVPPNPASQGMGDFPQSDSDTQYG